MALFLILMVVPVVAGLGLLRKWSIERAHKDIESQPLEQRDVDQLSTEQKATLTLLVIPPLIFITIMLLFIATNIAVFR